MSDDNREEDVLDRVTDLWKRAVGGGGGGGSAAGGGGYASPCPLLQGRACWD